MSVSSIAATSPASIRLRQSRWPSGQTRSKHGRQGSMRSTIRALSLNGGATVDGVEP